MQLTEADITGHAHMQSWAALSRKFGLVVTFNNVVTILAQLRIT